MIATEVEIFRDHTLLEVIPVSEVDVIEVVTPGPQGPTGSVGTANPLYINDGIRFVGYDDPFELALEIFDGTEWMEVFRYP